MFGSGVGTWPWSETTARGGGHPCQQELSGGGRAPPPLGAHTVGKQRPKCRALGGRATKGAGTRAAGDTSAVRREAGNPPPGNTPSRAGFGMEDQAKRLGPVVLGELRGFPEGGTLRSCASFTPGDSCHNRDNANPPVHRPSENLLKLTRTCHPKTPEQTKLGM